MSKNFLIIIPARFKSSRLPGKPLIDIKGKSMIKRVWEKCAIATEEENVIVATDDKRIEDHCLEHGMRVVMTSENCLTGTDRVSEVSRKLNADFYVNVQGDEPLLDPRDIKKVISAYLHDPQYTYCAMTKIDSSDDYNNLNIPKIVCRQDKSLIYISRAGIPSNKKGSSLPTMKQVCIYAFPKNHLEEYGLHKEKSELEKSEDIEILRLIEKGHGVKMVELSSSTIAVDTKEDLKKVLAKLNG